MARQSESKKQPTATEMREWYEKNKKRIENYDNASEALKKYRNVVKTNTKNINNYSKESVKGYLQAIGSNEVNLRSLSRYLYYRSQIYYRLVKYNSNQMDLSVRSVIPVYNLTADNDKDVMLRSYYDTLKTLNEMNLQYEFLKAYAIAFREDVTYNVAYYTEGEGFFLLPLDPDYCKIEGVYPDGSFAFAMDMTYFRRNQELLEFWGEPFESMNKEYEKTNIKWQSVPPEYAVCLKARAEDWDVVVPVFAPLFLSLISLLNLEDIQDVVDEQQIYKLIWSEMETINGSEIPDDFKIDPDLSLDYWERLTDEALPDYTSTAILPGKLNYIDFNNDAATDVSKVQKATQTILNTAGGAQILNSATISGTTAFNGSIRADAEFAISALLPQTQAIVNRLLSFYVSNPAKVKFFEVSVYTKEEFKKTMLESAQYGLPTKLMLNNLNGFSELDTLALNFLEEECLGLSDKLVPLQSSHTQSSSEIEGGGQNKDSTDLTDEGEASRDKKDKAKG